METAATTTSNTSTLNFISPNAVLILGDSGTGKSSSIRNLDPKETFIITTINKPLPFKKAKEYVVYNRKENPNGNLFQTSDSSTIVSLIDHIEKNMPHIKNIVIDDVQYEMLYNNMSLALEKGYDKFTNIAKATFDIYRRITSIKRSDLFIFVLSHIEEEKTGHGRKETRIKIKTAGKMIDSSIKLEGLFTTVLLTDVTREEEKAEYVFITQSDGSNPCKSPMDMLDYREPNDLALIRKKITEYYS